MINVLIFPAGEINSVELHAALSTSVNIKVFGAASVERHGAFVFRNYTPGLPFIDDDNFIPELNKLIAHNQIDVIFPTHDTVAEYFAINRSDIKAKIISDNPEASRICRDKLLTLNHFVGYDFTPTLYMRSFYKLPAFSKPRKGQGSVGARIVRTKEEFDMVIDDKDVVTCEYLTGDEFTVDCLTDKNGDLVVVSPRTRSRTMAGVSVGARTVADEVEFTRIADVINSKMVLRGLWFFQVKEDENGRLKLLEISTRCAGGMGLTRVRGANLPLMSVYVAMGYDVKAVLNGEEIIADRTLITRYKLDYEYKSVYIDFDDTVVIRGDVYTPVLSFIYQCRNKAVPVYLVTRHEEDIDQTLERYAISKDLFEGIFQLKQGENKAKCITKPKPIFIDNSFIERHRVKETLGIPVFDVDAIELLIDWRM